MRFSILFIAILPFFQPCDSSFNESHDDMLIQCRMNIKNLPKKREKHICEKENFDDDFDYQIANMEAPYSGQNFMCISFEKAQDQKLKFKLWFSHEKFTINAFGIKNANIARGVFESSAVFKSSFIVVVPTGNVTIPQIFGFELNGQDACPFCGQRLEPAAALIRGGTEVKTHYMYPWHMTIYHYESSNLQYKCGASLIRDNKIITAAHCVTYKNQKLHENKLIVRFEEDGKLFESTKYQYKVFRILVHERYSHETYENDIAILILETSIDIVHSKNIRAICLPPNGKTNFPNEGFVVGFGSTDRHLNASRILLETKLPIIQKDECRDSDPAFFARHLFDTNFCAGKRGFGVCSGDSGGGLFVYSKGLWILKGIVSNTKPNADSSIVNPTCSDDNYALFTDVAKYLDWIDKRISDN
ncbi:U21-ctenitoxin-Pn1a-like [Chironomus tepperi]|uniref:U21-ctenitoxin-Pn1a-like n=1 Tax=Chironomus tepperi TaxID=113505 RepID=UPI00391F2AD6